VDNNRTDSFFHLIQNSRKGKLKIYLGYCSGVGKTWQMLQEAKHLKDNHIDIAAGLVETHNRKDTNALLSIFEIIPPKIVTYRGIEIVEPDIEKILERKPAVVLIDELAHTNVPGSRNARRHEDVEALLEAGIHVISTMNIEHLESLHETLEQAGGIKVKDRIPDRILEQAEEIVNVDIATIDLRKRLVTCKITLYDHLEAPVSGYFSTGYLEQLRETTLREVAALNDAKTRNKLPEKSSSNPDQLMVFLSSEILDNEAMLRYASKIAGRFNKKWYAVHVQTITEKPAIVDEEMQGLLDTTFTLARDLGATVFTFKGDDVIKTILQFAREYQVGEIIIGNDGRKPSIWNRFLGRKSIFEQLINACNEIRVTAFNSGKEEAFIISENPELQPESNKQRVSPGTHPPNEWKELVMNAPVVLLEEVMEKEKAFRQLLCECCIVNPEIDEKIAFNILLERENQGATFVGSEIAIPHARLENLKIPVIVIGVHKRGIYDRQSGNTARIIFMLLTPASDPNSHIRMLGVISRMASDTQWRNMMIHEAAKKEPVVGRQLITREPF
jgi:two-component system, OmpR family, sensor histidine kinase KdpD